MTAVNNLLDKYKKVCSLTSDSALAGSLHMKRQAVHQWRKGISWPSEDHILAMTKAVNEPATRWLPLIEAERARNPEARKVWLRLAQVTAVVLAVYTAIRFSAAEHAAEALVLAPIYIMRNRGRADEVAGLQPERLKGASTFAPTLLAETTLSMRETALPQSAPPRTCSCLPCRSRAGRELPGNARKSTKSASAGARPKLCKLDRRHGGCDPSH